MGQTIRRQPGSVDVPSKDYIYHKNLIGFKGLDTRENPLVTDPLSCSDAKNVWVDANGNLTQRPRLQWVRRDLKVQDSDVVNVIYTDKAYWTLYYKEGTYSLTRTDLTTSTVTLFTIPEMTSPKIGITEFQGTYYLGCSSGYYSCIAGQTEFMAVVGYVPVGSTSASGLIYDEPHNILNKDIRVPLVGDDNIFLSGHTIAAFDKYEVYAKLEDDDKYHYYIVDTISGLVVYTLVPAFKEAAPSNGTFSIYRQGNTVYIYTALTLPASISANAPHLYRFTLTDNGLLDASYLLLTDTVWSQYITGGLLRNDINKQNTFTGVKYSLPTNWERAVWSNDNGHIYLNLSFRYMQWDFANKEKRYTTEEPTIATGQWCYEGISIDIDKRCEFGYGHNIQYKDWKLILRRCGIYILPEHQDVSPHICLLHLSRDNDVVIPSGQLRQTLCLVSTDSGLIVGNTMGYDSSSSDPEVAAKVPKLYVIGSTSLISNSYTYTGMTYYKLKYATIHFTGSVNIPIAIEGINYRKQRLTIAAISTSDVIQRTYEFTGDSVEQSDNTTIIKGLAWLGSEYRWPRSFITASGATAYLYISDTFFADVSNAKKLFSAGFFGDTILIYDGVNHYITQTRFRVLQANVSVEVPSIRGVLFLDNVYWWFGETNIYGNMNDDLTYLPETRKLDAPSKILNWVRLTDTSFIVFCESDTVIYYKDSSGLWLRTVLNLPFEIISPDETSEACYAALNTGPTYVTRNGIYEIALSENLFTNERQAQNISMTLATLEGGLLQKIIPNLLHIQTVRYKDWQLFIFKRQTGLTEVIAQEISTYNYFYWTLPIDFVSTYLADGEVYLVDKNAITYKLAETELLREYKNGDTVIASVKCYGDEVFNETEQTTELKQIDWFWHSAVLNLDTIQYYKTLLALIFGMNDYDDASRVMFEYQTDIYYKSHTEQPVKVYDDYVYKIRNTQKQAAIPRFMYIRVRCESVPIPDTPDCLPEEFMCKVNLSQITFKYKVLRGSLL